MAEILTKHPYVTVVKFAVAALNPEWEGIFRGYFGAVTRRLTIIVALAGLCACTGPEHRAPDLRLPAAYEAPAGGEALSTAQLDRWWLLFNDTELNSLEDDAAKNAPDARTAIITLTHDPKLDDPALDRALRSKAFYIGALGSRRTHARRLDRLRELGHDDAAMARIKGPVGLNIAAVTAPEIAVSILAEFVAKRRNAA